MEGGVVAVMNKRVLVTGGTGSLGERLVRGFADAGNDVTFLYCNSEGRARVLVEATGATAVRCDLLHDVDLADTAVDVLVNNAAINVGSKLAGDLSLDVWECTIGVNLTAPFRLIQQCLPHMMGRRWGRIINMSSIYGLHATETNLPYTVSKHGLSGLTKTVAREYGEYGITCNEICPGPMRSRLLERVCAERASASGVDVEQYMREVVEEVPTGELVAPDTVAQMALLLASERASSVNGSSIVIDGGMTA